MAVHRNGGFFSVPCLKVDFTDTEKGFVAKQMQTEACAPALGHVVCVSGSDHEDGDVSQRHQQVLSSARLSISSPPCRLEEMISDSSYEDFLSSVDGIKHISLQP